jgi:thioredoxin-related protein
MKNLINLLSVVIIFSTSCGSSHNKNAYELSLSDAKKHHKLILLDFSATWCGGCKAYDKYVFEDSATVEKLSEKFILLKIEKDNPENSTLVDKYHIGGLPHIVLIDAKEHILGSIAGFESRFADNPGMFIASLNNIIDYQDSIKTLESVFNADTANIKAAGNLLNACINVNQYIKIEELKNLLVRLDPTPDRLFEFNYNQAIHSLRQMNPEPALTFMVENPDMDFTHKWGVFSQLLYYYIDQDDIQNQDKYYSILTKLDPDYFAHKYAEFLFENKLKIDTAIILSNKYISDVKNRGFWCPYLRAHIQACSGKTDQAVQEYSSWMEKNKNVWISGDDYWILYFYSRFANFYNVDLKRALDYIQIAEKNRNMPEEKQLMAEILFKLGKVDESVKKLQEALSLTDSQNEFNRINRLIEKYQGN